MTLLSGEVLEGDIIHVTSDMLVIGITNNYGFQEREIEAVGTELVEVKTPTSTGKVLVLVAAGVGLVLMVVAVASSGG